MKIYTFIATICSVFLVSCSLEKEIDYDVYYAGDRIVVQGFIGKSVGVRAHVVKSLSPIQRDVPNYIPDAVVWLDADGKPYAQLAETDSSFFEAPSDLELFSGVAYTLRVEAPGLTSVVSTPQKLVEPMLVDTVFVSRKLYNSGKWFLGIWLQNDLNVHDYFTYEVHVFQGGEDQVYSEGNKRISDIRNDLSYNQAIIQFEYQANMSLPYTSSDGEKHGTPIDSVQVKAVTVSSEYYDFWESLKDYDQAYGDEFQEKIFPVKSNITNGYGFFCSCEKTNYTLFGPIER